MAMIRNLHANGTKENDGTERAASCTVVHKHIHLIWREALKIRHFLTLVRTSDFWSLNLSPPSPRRDNLSLPSARSVAPVFKIPAQIGTQPRSIYLTLLKFPHHHPPKRP